MKKIIISIFFAFYLIPLITQADDANLSSAIKIVGEDDYDVSGSSVSTAGDINNDGYDDFLIGAPAAGTYGVVYLFYGSATILSTPFDLSAADARFVGEDDFNSADRSVSTAGDVDNDGYDDFLIGSKYDNDGDVDAGAVYLIYGKSENFSGIIPLLTVVEGTTSGTKYLGVSGGDNVGSAVAKAGRLNNDDFSDFIIGADSLGPVDTGGAYIMYGNGIRGAPTISLTTYTLYQGVEDSDFAGSVASAGDVDGDGLSDILIGAYGNDGGASNGGAFYLIYGTNSYLSTHYLSSADAVFTGETAGDGLGWSVSSAGDIDNDGYDDFMASAPLANNGSTSDSGKVYLIYGSATRFSGINGADKVGGVTVPGIEYLGAAENDNLGSSLTLVGDSNKDTYDDFLIGADQSSSAGTGLAYLINGSNTRTTGEVNISSTGNRFIGEAAGDEAGDAVAPAGDLNNDGYDDFLVGAKENDSGAPDGGTTYLVYLYVDADVDGYAGTAGFYDGTDCNDNNATINATTLYYHDADGDGYGNDSVKRNFCSLTAPVGYVSNNLDCDDSNGGIHAPIIYYQDADGDTLGNPDVTTSVCYLIQPDGYVDNDDDPDDTVASNDEENPPEEYQELDPANEEAVEASIASVAGAKNGKIKVTYTNDKIYKYTVFNNLTTNKKTKVKQYKNTAYYLVLQPFGKKVAIVNALNGSVLDSKVLSKTEKYKKNSLKLFKFRKKHFAAVASKGKNKGQLGIVRVKISKTKFKEKSVVTPVKLNFKPVKTNKKNNFLQLRNKHKKIIERYLVNSQYKLILSS